MDLHPSIVRELPEHFDIFKRLRGSNGHFQNRYDECHRLDDEIHRIITHAPAEIPKGGFGHGD